MHEDEPGALADALVGDLESLRLNYPHRRNLPAQAELHGQVELHGCSTSLVRTGGAVAQSEQVASCSFRANQKQWLLPQAGGFECLVRIQKELDAGAFPTPRMVTHPFGIQ